MKITRIAAANASRKGGRALPRIGQWRGGRSFSSPRRSPRKIFTASPTRGPGDRHRPYIYGVIVTVVVITASTRRSTSNDGRRARRRSRTRGKPASSPRPWRRSWWRARIVGGKAPAPRLSIARLALFSFCRRFAAQATSGKTSSSAATARGSATRARPAPRRDIRGLLRERLCFARRTWLAKCCAWGENGGFWWPFECCGCYQGGPFENWVVSFNGWDRLPHPVGRPRRGVDHH